jgi:Tol biopolymer transport system component
LLLDTYPDDDRLQSLLVFDLTTEELVELGKFRQPLRFNDDLRCDLHPRWNRSGTKICFDSTHQGRRQIYVADLDEWLQRQDRR